MSIKNIAVVTVGRSDYGIYYPIFKEFEKQKINFGLLVSGSHLSAEFGNTVNVIKKDGFPVLEEIPVLADVDGPTGIIESMARSTLGFGQFYKEHNLDLLILLGDRFEMHAAAVAAVPYNIPIAHIHGGEISEGAIDNAFRHSITKLSHFHFVSTELSSARVLAMGENPAHVIVSGAPGLDNVLKLDLLGREVISEIIGIKSDSPFLLVTYHPVTLEIEDLAVQIDNLIAALEDIDTQVVFTASNADNGGRFINEKLRDRSSNDERFLFCENLGTQVYFSAMQYASAMIGNSSSGIIEAASFKLPVVNIGSRQDGRERSLNVIDTGYGKDQINEAIKKALSIEYQGSLKDIENIYGSGRASEKIVNYINELTLERSILKKPFYFNAIQ